MRLINHEDVDKKHSLYNNPAYTHVQTELSQESVAWFIGTSQPVNFSNSSEDSSSALHGYLL